MTILVVDGFESSRKGVNADLSHEDFRVREAGNGIEALRVLEQEPIDAVISDILMPNMDGYRLFTEVRRHERFNDVPFIFYMSTHLSPSDEAFALGLGADKFVRKPDPGRVMVDAVRELVSGRRGAWNLSERPTRNLEAQPRRFSSPARRLDGRNPFR